MSKAPVLHNYFRRCTSTRLCSLASSVTFQIHPFGNPWVLRHIEQQQDQGESGVTRWLAQRVQTGCAPTSRVLT